MVFALDGYSLLRFGGASVLLLGIYYGLYDRKACFLHCRYYLLLMVLVAALVSVLRIPVYDSGREFVVTPVRAGEVVEDAYQGRAASWQEGNPVAPAENVTPAVTEEEEMPGKEEKVWEAWQTGEVLFLIYGIVAFVFLLRWVFAVVGIFRLKRWGSCEEWEGMLVVRNNRVASPFSFFKMIFVNRKLQGETLRVVLAHEKTHIEHKHYRDTLAIEMYCILFWFNPFVWLVKRELKALHEFEVDRYLLNHGIELSKYQHIIFNELMGYGPAIANGFHNSMIKKRFIMMKTMNNIRYGLLRKMMLLPAVAGLTVLFAFTDKETVKEQIWLPFMEDVRMEEVVAVNNTLPDESDGLVAVQVEIAPVALSDRPLEEMRDTLTEQAVVVDDSVALQKYAPFKGREGFTFYPLTEEQVVISLFPYAREERIKYIETDANETRVTILVPIHYESNWVQFNKGFCILDKASGDIYMIRSMTRGVELNKTYVVKGHKNRMAEFTMVFPPLKKSVKVVTLCQKYPGMGASSPSNGRDSYFPNVRIADYLPPEDLAQYYDKEGRPRTERKVEYVGLRDDQVVMSTLPFESRTRIKSIETDGDETRLTIAVPIYYDNHWVHFSKGYCMEDCRTGDIYQVRAIDRGIELNKTVVVRGHKGKMVEFTMIFPKLKKKVKKVNIFLKYPEDTGLAPTNGAGSWDWRAVRLSRYEPSRITGQIYY